MADHFLTKNHVDLDTCLPYGNGLAIEAYGALHAALNARIGPEAARLFAEPLLSRGNDTAPASISWYTDVEGGGGQPLTKLGDAAQKEMVAQVSAEMRQIRDLMDDPDDGGLVAAALNVLSPGDIWVVGGKPVILNWGMLPADLPRTPEARASHYASTLGRFLPMAAAPPVTEGERASRKAGMVGSGAATTAVAAGAGVASAGTGGDDVPPRSAPSGTAAHAPPPPSQAGRMPVLAWLPLAVLLLLAAGVLVWLLIPGTRLFPDLARDRAVTSEAAIIAAEGVNTALEERLAGLESALAGASCRADGTLLMPDGRTVEGLLPPDPNNPNDAPGTIQQAAPLSVLPPNPARVQVPDESPGASPQDTTSLVAHIDARTALVLAASPDGGLSTGTGFFVGPDLLVTNHHVIDGGAVDGIFVTNRAMGSLQSATVIKSLGPLENTGSDYALLRVAGVNQPFFDLLRTSASLTLQSVVAAGYPGDLLRTDDSFTALREGNLQAVPDIVMTDGTISTSQMYASQTRVYVHSAPISTGNSGGPLLDMCGRVVGVNTFVRTGNLRNNYFALSSESLLGFLADTGALPEVVTEVCAPRIQRPNPVPQAVAAQGDVPTPQALPAAPGGTALPPLAPAVE